MLSSGRAGPIFKIPVEQRPDSIDAAFDSQRCVLVWSTSKQVSMLRLSPKTQLFDERPRAGDRPRGVERWCRLRQGKWLVTLLARALTRQAVMVNLRSEYSMEPGPHVGVGAEPYARFSAPRREMVGVFLHKEAVELLTGVHPPRSARCRTLRTKS